LAAVNAAIDEHPARVRAPVLGDPPVVGRLAAGLLDARVQPEIGDQLLGGAEPPELTDGRDQRERDRRVDAGDRHQPADLGALERDPAELRVDDPQLLGVEVELPQQRLDRVMLVGRQMLI
jgi:hypothetical protein